MKNNINTTQTPEISLSFTLNLAEYLQEKYNNKQELDLALVQEMLKDTHMRDSKTPRGLSAFMIALLFGDDKLTKLFIDSGVDVNQRTIYKADKEKYLISQEFQCEYPVTFQEEIELHLISFVTINYDVNQLKLLIEYGLDVNQLIINLDRLSIGIIDRPMSMLQCAILNNDIDTIKYLLEHTDQIHSISACHELRTIVQAGDIELLKLLVEAGADLREDDDFRLSSSLLSICAEHKASNVYYEMGKYLIEKGINVNYGQPLFTALHNDELTFGLKLDNCYGINIKMAKLLIDSGANVNDVIASDNSSVLMHACQGTSNEIVKLLIKNGAEINHKDNHGNSVLMHIKYDNSEKIMQLLINNGTDVNAKNKMGLTPLMYFALKGEERLVKILIENGADINAKSEMTAFDMAQNDEIKTLIQQSKNNYPQKLVKLLTNFTLDKPIKYTVHNEFDNFYSVLKKEYGSFEGYMQAVRTQFEKMDRDLKELSLHLYQKIYTFLLETSPDKNYSWCSQAIINIGWSSLEGLREHCDSGKNPFDFKLKQPILLPPRRQVSTFGEIINLFKQEIEIRNDFKNLEPIFSAQKNKLGNAFDFDISTSKLTRKFYTDTQKFNYAINKIFDAIKNRPEFPKVELTTQELDDRSIEIKITQIGSTATKNALGSCEEINSGDFADIKASLTNLCDWSIESSFEDENFRINYLHSNNVKEVEMLDDKPSGFTHVLRFYI